MVEANKNVVGNLVWHRYQNGCLTLSRHYASTIFPLMIENRNGQVAS